MGLPHALGYLHVREHCRKRELFRRAGIDAEADFVRSGVHMADTHLAEVDTVVGAFDAVVICPAGETIPHYLYIGRNGRCSPVRVAVVGGDAAQMLELLVFKLYRSFEPVVDVTVFAGRVLGSRFYLLYCLRETSRRKTTIVRFLPTLFFIIFVFAS